MADDAYQPTGSNEEQEDAAPLDLQDAVDERTYDDTLDEGYSPPEKPLGVTKRGTTAAEQHEGETLDDRLSQEVPDVSAEPVGDGVGDTPDSDGEPVDPEAGTNRAGRLVAPDEGAHPDTTKESVATDLGIDGGAAGAEEAAVHVVEDDGALPEDDDRACPPAPSGGLRQQLLQRGRALRGQLAPGPFQGVRGEVLARGEDEVLRRHVGAGAGVEQAVRGGAVLGRPGRGGL
jgi:hypothetical protein